MSECDVRRRGERCHTCDRTDMIHKEKQMTESLTVPQKPNKSQTYLLDHKVKSDGHYLDSTDISYGPFPNKAETWWYMSQILDILDGNKDKELFAGQIVEHPDPDIGLAYYVERWDQYDGPFTDKDIATNYRQHLYDKFNAYPDDYVGIVFQRGENKFWVDRGNNYDGPFPTREAAQQHHDELMANINKDKTNAPGEDK